VPFPAPHSINALRVTQMQWFQDSLLQSDFRFRNGDEMNMVRHQAIDQNLHPIPVTIFSQPVEISQAIIAGKKDVFLAVPPLCHVMWDPGKDRSA
jgi:hypothetical protein